MAIDRSNNFETVALLVAFSSDERILMVPYLRGESLQPKLQLYNFGLATPSTWKYLNAGTSLAYHIDNTKVRQSFMQEEFHLQDSVRKMSGFLEAQRNNVGFGADIIFGFLGFWNRKFVRVWYRTQELTIRSARLSWLRHSNFKIQGSF